MARISGSGECPECGGQHDGVAAGFGFPAPDPWATATADERGAGQLDADSCALVVSGFAQYFLRGVIEVPVTDGEPGAFTWSVWVRLDHDEMLQIARHWKDEDRARLAPVFGWLSNELPYEKPTSMLPVRVRLRPPGQAPSVDLDPSVPHVLAFEQADGITSHRVAEISQFMLG
jgi:hypothetical protein